MVKKPYDPNDPNAVPDDPLGPHQPGAPTSTAPTAARSALLSQMGGSQTIDDPNTPTPQVGGYPTIASSPTEGIPAPTGTPLPTPPGGVPAPLGDPRELPPIPSSPTEGAPPTSTPFGDPNAPTPQVASGPGNPGNPSALPPGVAPVPGVAYGYGAQGNPTVQDDPNAAPSPGAPAGPAATATTSGASKPHVVDATPDQIAAIYAKNHLHPPSADEIESWLNGTYGDVHSLADIDAQIGASGEASSYRDNHGGNYDGNAKAWMAAVADPNALLSWVKTQKPGMSDAEANSWADYFRKNPGQNEQEQAGGAAYWRQWILTGKNPSGGVEGGSGGTTDTGGYRTVQPSPYNEHLRQWMMDQLGNLSQPIGADSGELAPAISAYNTQSQRDQQLERDQLAEHAYAGGNLDSGGFDTQIRQGIEGAAGKRANFTGSMVFQANTQRKQQLQAMLQTAVSAGLTDQAQQIQQAIAQIDAQLRGDQLGFNYADLIARQNRDALLAGLHG